MLGVLPEYRNCGLGRRLKLRQREDALARGIDLIEWTFDPLEIKNAYFNIERLGAIVRRYVRNQYGTTTSHLHGGPADGPLHRGMVDRTRERVARVIAGEPCRETARRGSDRGRRSRRTSDTRERFRPQSADQFEAAFDRGLAVIGVERLRSAGRICWRSMRMKIERIVLRQLRMPLVHFFETSFGRTYERDIVIVEVVADGLSGWGEITAGENPFYNEEWTESAWLIARDYVAPRVLGREIRRALRMWTR